MSTYAASCKLQIERRTIPGETEAQVLHEIEEMVARLSAADPAFKATVKSFFVREPFEIVSQAGIVRTLHQVAMRVMGKEPAYVSQTFWTDAAILSAAGAETVIIGPRGGGKIG